VFVCGIYIMWCQISFYTLTKRDPILSIVFVRDQQTPFPHSVIENSCLGSALSACTSPVEYRDLQLRGKQNKLNHNTLGF
jgi:hypothetical protein